MADVICIFGLSQKIDSTLAIYGSRSRCTTNLSRKALAAGLFGVFSARTHAQVVEQNSLNDGTSERLLPHPQLTLYGSINKPRSADVILHLVKSFRI